jgi:outer membrane protein OmpA-like peptidoglycan-associated protein
MSATAAEGLDTRRRIERRQLIGALALAGLLVLLPLVGIGPTTWRQCVGQASANVPLAAVAEPKPVTKPPLPAPPSTPAEASPPSVPATATAGPQAAVPSAPSPVAAAAPTSAPGPAPAPPSAPLTKPAPPMAVAPKTVTAPAPTPVQAAPRAVLYFAFDSDKLRPDANRRLAPIVAYLKAKGDAKVQIRGFHDPRGHPLYNEDLARRRAVAVSAALERAGVKRHRIVLAKPADAAATGNRAEARRTEVTIVR